MTGMFPLAVPFSPAAAATAASAVRMRANASLEMYEFEYGKNTTCPALGPLLTSTLLRVAGVHACMRICGTPLSTQYIGCMGTITS